MSEHLTAGAVQARSTAKSAAIVAGLVVLGACLALLVASLTGRVPGKAKARFAVVDLASVVRKNQEAAVSLLASGTADQRTRDATLAAAQGFGKRLDAEVVELSRECGCVLLMREAVVAGEVEDLTPALLSRLNKH